MAANQQQHAEDMGLLTASPEPEKEQQQNADDPGLLIASPKPEKEQRKTAEHPGLPTKPIESTAPTVPEKEHEQQNADDPCLITASPEPEKDKLQPQNADDPGLLTASLEPEKDQQPQNADDPGLPAVPSEEPKEEQEQQDLECNETSLSSVFSVDNQPQTQTQTETQIQTQDSPFHPPPRVAPEALESPAEKNIPPQGITEEAQHAEAAVPPTLRQEEHTLIPSIFSNAKIAEGENPDETPVLERSSSNNIVAKSQLPEQYPKESEPQPEPEPRSTTTSFSSIFSNRPSPALSSFSTFTGILPDETEKAEPGANETLPKPSSFSSLFANRKPASESQPQPRPQTPPPPLLSNQSRHEENLGLSIPSIFGAPIQEEEEESLFVSDYENDDNKVPDHSDLDLILEQSQDRDQDQDQGQDIDLSHHASGATAASTSNPLGLAGIAEPDDFESALDSNLYPEAVDEEEEEEHDEAEIPKPSATDLFFAAKEKKRKASTSKPSIRDLGVIINSRIRPRIQKSTIGLSGAWQDQDESGNYEPDSEDEDHDNRRARRGKTKKGKRKRVSKGKGKEVEVLSKERVEETPSIPSTPPSPIRTSLVEDEGIGDKEGEGKKEEEEEEEEKEEEEPSLPPSLSTSPGPVSTAKKTKKKPQKPRMEFYSQQLKRKEKERRERTAARAIARAQKKRELERSRAGSPSSYGLYVDKKTKKQVALHAKISQKPSPPPSLLAGHTLSGKPVRIVTTCFCYPLTFNWIPTSSSTSRDEKCDWCESAFFGLCGYGETIVSLAPHLDRETNTWIEEELENGHSETGKRPSNMCVACTTDRVRILSCARHVVEPLPQLSPKTFDVKALYESVAAFADGDLERGKLANSTRWCSVCPSPAFFACTAPQLYTSTGELAHDATRDYGCSLLLCEACADLMRKTQYCYRGPRSIIDRVVAGARDSLSGTYEEPGMRADASFLLDDGELCRFITGGKVEAEVKDDQPKDTSGLPGDSAENPMEIDDDPYEIDDNWEA
ncbi:hypothetical protein PVAG01_00117 [Phlyctema vagabunda]|uniref:Uncharacterized protein n=1 Tax=Phlyctema vagabunda TaxID=108571 RepID=A0ABR4PTT2_9HELO